MNDAIKALLANKILFLAAVILVLLGLGMGYWFGNLGNGETAMEAAEDKPLFYRNPMNPAITSPVPAQDEMGMDYIPVYADEDAGQAPVGTVSIDPVTVQNIGVRTAKVEQRQLTRTLTTVGRVSYNEEKLARLHPKTEGWIEKLYINKTGEYVDKDTILLEIYSPQLVTSQQEYLLALKNWRTLKASPFADIRDGARDLVRTSRERLELLDVPEHQIKELTQSGKIKKSLHIHSPFQGIITRIGAREGEYVTPTTELYTIADLSQVWVYADVYEDELPWIKTGDNAEMRLSSAPGKVFQGQIRYIYPYAETKTRSIKVRMVFDNPDLLLKPDSFAETTIHASRQTDGLTVPSEAIVRSGTRNLVFVVREPGKFEPREVTLGLTSDGFTQIVRGVKLDEQIVTSAQFLIDSESKLREAASKMLEAGSADNRNVENGAQQQSEHQHHLMQPQEPTHQEHQQDSGHEMPKDTTSDTPKQQGHQHD